MTDIESIREFLDWQEEQRLAGKPHDLEAFEAAQYLRSLEDAIREVQAILESGPETGDDSLYLIGSVLHDDLLA
jgi:hypothetical protein